MMTKSNTTLNIVGLCFGCSVIVYFQIDIILLLILVNIIYGGRIGYLTIYATVDKYRHASNASLLGYGGRVLVVLVLSYLYTPIMVVIPLSDAESNIIPIAKILLFVSCGCWICKGFTPLCGVMSVAYLHIIYVYFWPFLAGESLTRHLFGVYLVLAPVYMKLLFKWLHD